MVLENIVILGIRVSQPVTVLKLSCWIVLHQCNQDTKSRAPVSIVLPERIVR